MTGLMSRSDVAQLLAVSLQTVDRLRQRGILRGTKILGVIRFEPGHVRSVLEEMREGRLRATSHDRPAQVDC